jgi:energy-coupling factor transporter ATP-binding protein EcfA2
VLTGDNITKMMFALYRIRCGLPVVAFGEAGVGKSALFRFLIQTLLGHTFEVFNVNSGTSIQHVKESIECAVTIVMMNPEAQVFLFFDEMNTAILLSSLSSKSCSIATVTELFCRKIYT